MSKPPPVPLPSEPGRQEPAAAPAAGDARRELIGHTAVVTGSSSGIGRAIALALAAAGANVLVHARQSTAAAAAVASQAAALGGDSLVKLADLADSVQRRRFIEDAFAWHGRVDIWVNNAGADVLTGEAAQWSFEQKLAALWRLDVEATVQLSREAGARLRRQGRGVILNIGWDQAEQGMSGDSGELFAATKGAVMAFTRSLAQSLAPQVRVNCVAPGWIRTAWGQHASDDWQRRAADECLLARWGTPEDVAQVACFLASPAAAFINGQIVPVNGGWRRAR